ncbi:MAG: hypothetical protein LBV09_02585 [Deferribacteraceae bacterium]|jgi:hypothetical protein|nr:hypothetical protein [Deferribacteraceae bacterium]
MIISDNRKPTLEEFTTLVYETNSFLNSNFATSLKIKEHSGVALEKIVFNAMTDMAVKTKFNNTLQLVSGHKFPDIVAGKYYGVEVKSTTQDHWQTTGNSVLENSRVQDVERIFIIFGKLADPVEFKARPYEECLSDIVVTHSPRYKIDMKLPENSTIFDKMNIDYDTLRTLDNPIEPIVDYYRGNLRDGEALWWINDSVTTSIKVRLWRTLSNDEKLLHTTEAFALFPNILHNGSKKYEELSLWLVAKYGIVSTSMRDTFTAGGVVTIDTGKGVFKDIPRIFGNINKNKDKIMEYILNADEGVLKQTWHVDKILSNRLKQWIDIANSNNKEYYNILTSIFKSQL